MTVWVIVTTSLIDGVGKGRDYDTRKKEYISGILKILKAFQGCQIVIVENNSLTKKLLSFTSHTTFLDVFNAPVLYTRNNKFKTRNYGMKELLDVFDCIKKFNIQDDDFIVKITGRYMIDENSRFLHEVKQLSTTNYDAIVRYGSYQEHPPPLENNGNCVTGLIGLRCKYVKQIEIPDEDTYVEMKWAKAISNLEPSKICVLSELGIYIRPEMRPNYFSV